MGNLYSKLAALPPTQPSTHEKSSKAIVRGEKDDCASSFHKPEPELPLAFGASLRKEFMMDQDYHNLNHASFGTHPRAIHQRLQHYRTLYERAPDHFIRYTYPALLDTNRAAVARFLNSPSPDAIVMVPNATVGINTVLRALAATWSPSGTDEILYFSTAYGACAKTVTYLSESTFGRHVGGRAITLTYPLSDTSVVAQFHAAVVTSRTEGHTPRLAMFDTVSSVPGVRFPFEAVVTACRELGILSLVDAAQGIGMLPLDLAELNPDFLVSNCHKWLLVPRACAVLYVPVRNQHLIRSTLPTSHGFVPQDTAEAGLAGKSPLPKSEDGKSAFVAAFEYVGTLDNSPYLCVAEAIEWRSKMLGGEDRIRHYTWSLASQGGEEVAKTLGTWVMQNKENTLTDCAMVNVALPLVVVDEGWKQSQDSPMLSEVGAKVREADVEEAAPVNNPEPGEEQKEDTAVAPAREDETMIPFEDAERIWEWMTKVLVDDYRTFIPIYYHAGRFWARLSAQVYLDMADFVWAGATLKELCQRVARKEYDT
ncbi:pyridoxal phosphate-dependent transferase [Coniella lustricola]|uniref:Pyridoxal phosphate-dependent transferase n=1 Tax=Coniella lustricola TaxID=2025994 RepID=A0A2T3ANQ3_9PEZI|nr:pyridoxal phosphate-dependent transferase [Coniella lustricola]